jgi:hypothetical protein
LPRAGSSGQPFVVSFTPFEYGKTAVGTLVITTKEMQWSYEVGAALSLRAFACPRAPTRAVAAHARQSPPTPTALPYGACPAFPPTLQVRGKPPVFVLPEAKKRIDDQIGPVIERRLQENKLASQQKNHLRRNMQNFWR